MREIKFRAWNPLDKQMMGPWNWNDIISGDMSVHPSGDFCPPMQFTGLYDANGKEIYEGDILATSNDGADGCDIWDQEIMGAVFWDSVYARWGHRIDVGTEESIYSPQYVSIIGNIYENPDLC